MTTEFEIVDRNTEKVVFKEIMPPQARTEDIACSRCGKAIRPDDHLSYAANYDHKGEICAATPAHRWCTSRPDGTWEPRPEGR